jgi:oligopeptide transport system ATP-binding protein
MMLEVKDLRVSFDTYAGEVQAVRGVSFSLDKGEVLAIVGESGCGKSVTSQAIMGLVSKPAGRIKSGSIVLNGRDLTKINEREYQSVRGSEVGMIFQDPMTSLNPTMTIGAQIAEGIIRHQKLKRKEAMARAVDMLKLVEIPNPEQRARQYPHEFSGGMRQRAMVAIALACHPGLLIADEPTTALDVTIQAQVLDLMRHLKEQLGMAIIMITHDLGVVANIAQRVMVMYAGLIVEEGGLDDIYYKSRHPYTWGLMNSVPRMDWDKERKLASIEGTPPDLFNPPPGCPFADRCDWAMRVCREAMPEAYPVGDGHRCSCWLMHPDAPKVAVPFAREAS